MEEDLNTATPLIIPAACPVDNRPTGAPRLWGGLKITVMPDTLAFRAYRTDRIEESFTCNYELNPEYRQELEKTGLKVSGVTEEGGARIVELPDHRFFIGTGFVPQLTSDENKPHPLILAFLKAATK
jgi:CTP synthase (UTP-ammonia lyase)